MTTTEIAVQQAAPLAEKMEWARAMSTGTMLPRAYQGNPANLLFALEYADTLGIPRINALTSIHVIDGKPTASADLIASLVRKAGHKLRVTGDDTFAEATIIRADDPDFETTVRWDEAKARKAGKWGSKGPWTNYPAAMLRARAITEVARMAASDALYGVIYTPEELGSDVSSDGTPIITSAQPAQAPRQARRRPTSISEALAPETPVAVDIESMMAAALATDDLDALRGMWKEASALGEEGEELRDLILNRSDDLRNAPVESEQQTLDAEIVTEEAVNA
ncbi:hypothetical protein [Prescottella agglutinans]|uniref:Recombinase RecT n=1 Tax=Prescottella agglutinans TaxID=1644129 RepID=A0ABT6MFP1_9NOCA|nr:hypothetical protein [Prescottella agglutinans]MDH6283143.1 hypothetical protein [Prescottella agglutinans]